jgi:hypothetical protein
MSSRNLVIFTCILMVILSSLACEIPSATLSDEEFAELARPTCQSLKVELGNIDASDLILHQIFEMRAAAYTQTAEQMAEINVSEESAPYATVLRATLAELAGVNINFAGALEQALAEADLKSSGKLTLLTTETGRVMVTTGSIFEMTTLDIDMALASSLYTLRITINEAASALGLEDCMLEK